LFVELGGVAMTPNRAFEAGDTSAGWDFVAATELGGVAMTPNRAFEGPLAGWPAFGTGACVSTPASFDVFEAMPVAGGVWTACGGTEAFACTEELTLPVVRDGNEFVGEDAAAPTAVLLCGVYTVAPFSRESPAVLLGVEGPLDAEWGV
jgi:hypothetical protein